MAKLICKIIGILFVVVGSAVLSFGGPTVDKIHFAVHLVHGLILIGFGFFGSINQAKIVCVVSGIFYLALALPGFFLGNSAMHREWHIGPMKLNIADHIFHTVLSAGLIAVGIFSKSKA